MIANKMETTYVVFSVEKKICILNRILPHTLSDVFKAHSEADSFDELFINVSCGREAVGNQEMPGTQDCFLTWVCLSVLCRKPDLTTYTIKFLEKHKQLLSS